MTRRIAFVVPRYGHHILGGAETLVRTFAERLAARGDLVTVFTTCIRDYFTWSNQEQPGSSLIDGVRIQRFPVMGGWPSQRWNDLQGRLPALSRDEQYDWVDCLPHAPALYRALTEQAADFDVFFLAPYLFSTTYFGALAILPKAVMWPCLHDESYAHLHPTRVLLERVRGLAFNTEAERDLARRLGVNHARGFVIGAGVELAGGPTPGAALTVPSCNYVMYAGRLETPKNLHVLVDFFARYKARRPGDLKLVVSGSGPLETVRHPDLIHYGFLLRADLLTLMHRATVFCQPSVNESFSYVIMEAWLAGAPVLVNRQCAVTLEHVTKSGGGLAFGDYDSFEQALDQLLQHPHRRDSLAAAGHRYVSSQYNWTAVLGRLDRALDTWCEPR